jgi:hypothetical protein
MSILENLGFFGSAKSGWGGEEILKRIINTILLGLLAIILFACAFSRLSFLQIVSTSLLLAGASCISGALLGLIFGIPRTEGMMSRDEGNSKTEEDDEDKGNKQGKVRPNTNLEQISDWLTKILVGAGLTQINAIISWFHKVVIYFAPYFEKNEALVAAIIIYFLVSGFILGFLWSRLYMAGAIMKAETELLKEQIVNEVQNKVQKKEQNDARALSIVNQMLDADPGVVNIKQDDLNEFICRASPVVRVTIFNQAQLFRQENWRDDEDRNKLIRVIPIFKALITCDTEGKFHRNHAQLGYTLKDQVNPEYKAAEAEFTKAMNIRDKEGKNGKWLLYEFNRAYCRIKINEKDAKDVFSQDDIYKDIQAAAQSNSIKNIISREGVFIEWLKNHKLTI